MECYACNNEASRQCRRCARVFCELHGGDLCAECMSPASSLPSFNLYRGSLLALLVGTAVALWLLVQPPGSGGNASQVQLEITTTPVVTQAPDDGGTPAPRRTATVTAGTPTPGATDGPEPTAGPPAPREYVVQDGDSLITIAEANAPAGVSAFDYAQQIADASGLASVDEPITPGQTLLLP